MKGLGVPVSVADKLMENYKSLVEPDKKLLKRIRVRKRWETLPEYLLGVYHANSVSLLSLIEAGFSEETLLRNEVGYDKRRERITFPIRDLNGRLVAISGRTIHSDVRPKYKVYGKKELRDIAPGYVGMNKLHLYLFHLYYAEHSMSNEAVPLIIVEGYKGALWLQQKGFRAVAVQGDSLSMEQRNLLKIIPGRKYVLLDNEEGKSFSDRDGKCAAIKIVKGLGRRAFLCQYPKDMEIGTSPDDLSEEQIRSIVNDAKTLSQKTPPKKWQRRINGYKKIRKKF